MIQKNIPIFFFSGTGNTWWVAKHLAGALSKHNSEASIHSIEQVTPQQVGDLIDQSDLIGLGYPIYGSDAPLIMQEFIAGLPKQGETKPMLVFVTQAAWSGDGAYFIRPEVEANGYQVRWAVHFTMPNNINVDLGWVLNAFLRLFRAKPSNTLPRIEKLARKMVEGHDWIMGQSPCFSLGWVQRVPFRKGIETLQQGTYQVDSEKCNACGRCERICPVGNISMVDGLPRYDSHCILCLRCFNYCPQLAIEAFGKPFNPDWFGEKPYQGPEPEFSPEQLINKAPRSF